MSNDIYRLRAWYPDAETAETIEGQRNKLYAIVKNTLWDPEDFGLEITTTPVVYDDDGIINIDCAQGIEWQSCTMGDLKTMQNQNGNI